MNKRTLKRLPEVKSLYDLLPKGVEGGKEFARVVDLLLFQEARREGRKISIFNDAAGDYYGLDSFEGDAFRREGTTGYQYKFYPSPLSNEHRAMIAASLERVASRKRELRLKKWILVTPQDLLQSSARKTGGDLTWFESLRSTFKLNFEIEHWGHKKLLSLFLQTPSLCLFYYPELSSNDSSRKTIEDIRARYDENLITLYRNIEFVGMSVYKQEASKGVPMEHIYIPLTTIPETADERDANVTRINPLKFLDPGSRRVVLGDPGSGKSTLLRFLTLVGTSTALQERCNAKPDKRLPILITLRRYADELKTRRQLALIDYIQECVQADFSLKSAELDFFEYYLESGQALLLFDGLDELPTPQFKQTIRDRIRTLTTTYPGNTVLVTSRIVGYESNFRFNEKEFGHFRLTKLELSEMKAFVRDWYQARIENAQERAANAEDLIRILQNEGNTAIRELAENPLLLTIVALVHRIDAVLPDERVVLYQKCTETLLNTWHVWKYKDTEIKNRGREERRNRRRMEAIANWMHSQSISIAKDQRAVVPVSDLHRFLTEYITTTEAPYDPDSDPQDVATEFLEFVKKKAGLLVEVGDERYSFVHQTFQEYLTASYIITSNEGIGVEGIWRDIKARCNDPRWLEVIRLLVADLSSLTSQRNIVDKLLRSRSKRNDSKALLLTGLLIDGVEPAEFHVKIIIEQLLSSISSADDESQFRSLLNMLRAWLSKDNTDEQVVRQALDDLSRTAISSPKLLKFLLLASMLGWTEFITSTRLSRLKSVKNASLLRLFVLPGNHRIQLSRLEGEFNALWNLQSYLSLTSAATNLIASMCSALTPSLAPGLCARRRFEEQLMLLAVEFYGPFSDFNFNLLILSCSDKTKKCQSFIDPKREFIVPDRDSQLAKFLLSLNPFHTKSFEVRGVARDRASVLKNHELPKNLETELHLFSRDVDRRWEQVLASSKFCSDVLDLILLSFKISSHPHWKEALRVCFLPTIPSRLSDLFSSQRLSALERDLVAGTLNQESIYDIARLFLFECWLLSMGISHPTLQRLADLAIKVKAPPIKIALCIRGLCKGDKSQKAELRRLLESDDLAYTKIFETSLWRDNN